eukprot:7598149-Alexandrium_andersonii.AAC.1
MRRLWDAQPQPDSNFPNVAPRRQGSSNVAARLRLARAREAKALKKLRTVQETTEAVADSAAVVSLATDIQRR